MKHQFTHRVIYQDTDAEGVVYYANYLGFFERGRTELLRQMGVSLKAMKEKQGIVFAIIKAECDYRSPAFYDDEITIVTEIESVTPARVVFKQSALRKDKVLVSAAITACALDIKAFKPVRVPKELSSHVS
ncbi:MAG: tol-pal system-associated acyl-CoA thioesterase [Candidatus Margulisbacteria bacterium]|nr:tol-pal system-associated acyl-CoA thioesterase [Candidatus Margulisiibacteriota bacterium]